MLFLYEDALLIYDLYGLHLDPWNWTYLEQYLIENVSCGPHFITVEIFNSIDSTLIHNYTHAFVVTIDEDITTCSGDYIDFRVDMRDIGAIALAFGTSPEYPGEPPRWNEAYDVNYDGKIDMKDVAIAARNFGWPYT